MTVDSEVASETTPSDVSTTASRTEEADAACEDAVDDQTIQQTTRFKLTVRSWRRVLACAILPGLVFMLTLGAGYLKWLDASARQSRTAAQQSVTAATQSTIALLSYRPDTIDKELTAAQDRLTGNFKDAYTALIRDVVIPGAKQKQISAVANVAAAASVSADPSRAVVLVFVNQTITVGNDAPTDTASSIRVTLAKVHDRWLISQFEPI
jgi:Mce-associated membrane protein